MGNLAPRLGAVVLLLLIWQGVAWLGLWPTYLFPPPGDVLLTLGRLASSGELLVALLVTTRRVALGFGMAALGGVMLGAALARWEVLREAVGSLVMGLQSLPSICWLPLAVLWMGLTETSMLFVTTVGALFAVASATDGAIRSLAPSYLQAAATMGARGIQLFTRVVLPAALPSLLTGLRMGWSFAWRSLMAAELLFMNLGVGHLLGIGRELADAAQVVAVILVILAMGLLVDRLVFARWERSVRIRWGLDQAA